MTGIEPVRVRLPGKELELQPVMRVAHGLEHLGVQNAMFGAAVGAVERFPRFSDDFLTTDWVATDVHGTPPFLE